MKKWHLYVGNLYKGTTKESIAAFLYDVDIKFLFCELFDRDEFVSAHIVVPTDKQYIVGIGPDTQLVSTL